MSAITGAARSWLPAARTRAAIAKRLQAASSEMTTAALAEIAARHSWFAELEAEHRSWVTLVARAGIDGFVDWFTEDGRDVETTQIFDAAPRSLMRRISLLQTVDLIRTTIDTVEHHIERLPRGDRPTLHLAIVSYSREVAFAAAEVYARAAEARGGWDARLEALVVDAVLRGEADEAVVSRASTLGWHAATGIVVAIGGNPDSPDEAIENLRLRGQAQGLDVLAASQGDRLVLILGGELADQAAAVKAVAALAEFFGPGQVVVGPVVADLMQGAASARAALSGMRSAHAWAAAPRPVAADDLLPERALAGDGHARRTLAREVYAPLVDAGADLLETLAQLLDHGGSIEATARALFVHPNTVRYRMRRIAEVTGHHPADPRDAYVLHLALTLGRLLA